MIAPMSALPPAPAIHRMWLKTDGDRADIERLCLDSGLLGMGWGYHWRPQPPPKVITWEKYFGWASSQWPGRAIANVARFHDADGFVWTRTADGIYYLAAFTGEWEYRRGEPYDSLDLNNVRQAQIEKIGAETEVPGALVRRFARQGQTFCQVHDDSAARYSALLWARHTGARYDWRPALKDVLDVLLSPFDVQDLVAAYLQVQRGWLLFPSRLSDSTAAYEYVMRDPATGHSYAVQVKTGDATIDLITLPKAPGLKGWIVFSSRSAYRGRRPGHIEKLDADEILRFMADRRSALPPIVDTWVQASRSEPQPPGQQ